MRRVCERDVPHKLSRRREATRVGIIKQKPDLPVLRRHLPDLRNLGALLRTLLLVNLFALGTVFIAEPNPARLFEAFLTFAARLEPPLLASILLYMAAVRGLAQLSWPVGVAVTVVGVLGVVAA